jgi:Domain of unknown function (DUF4333)
VRKLAVAGLLAVGVLAGCGGTSVDEVEEQVGDEIKAQLQRQGQRTDVEGTAAMVDHIDCPDDVDTEEGAMFRCRALDAQDEVVGTVTVQMRSDGDARWQFVAAAPS